MILYECCICYTSENIINSYCGCTANYCELCIKKIKKCSICHNKIKNKNPIEIINNQKRTIDKYRYMIIGLLMGFISMFIILEVTFNMNNNITLIRTTDDNEIVLNYNDTQIEFENNKNMDEYINIYEGRIQFEVENKKYYIKYCDKNKDRLCLDKTNGETFKIYRKLEGIFERMIYWIYDNNFWKYSNSTYEIKSFIINPNKTFSWNKSYGLQYLY